MNSLTNATEIKTMSSREIAELTGKRHDNVLADIRKMLAEIQSPEKLGDYKDSRGRTYQMLLLDKEETLILVSGYSIKMRAAIIRRWQELEAQANKPALPDFANPAEAARAWATEYEQKLIAQEKLSIAAPKAEVYDRIVERNNLYNATQVAQKFGQSAVWMNKQLEQFGVYNRSVKRGRVFRQWFVDKGYGIMRETETGHSQAMFFAEGEMWIIGKLTEEGLI
ncbi:Rha family transcriptional regulator [Salmonella enterica]